MSFMVFGSGPTPPYNESVNNLETWIENLS
jgi:hypothetical protein